MKILNFKFVTTALFLLLALFAAGFTAQSAPDTLARSETVSVQQAAEGDSLGDGFCIVSETDAVIPS